jgi:hypothetical protein
MVDEAADDRSEEDVLGGVARPGERGEEGLEVLRCRVRPNRESHSAELRACVCKALGVVSRTRRNPRDYSVRPMGRGWIGD